MGGFGSPSTSQRTVQVNRQITLSGNAVHNAPVTRNSGNVNRPIRVAGRGVYDARTFTTVEGISEDRIAEILDAFSSRIEPASAPASPIVIPVTGGTAPFGASPSPAQQAIEDRIAGNVNEGTPDSKGTIKTVLWIAGVGLLALLVIVGLGMFLLRKLRKRKGTA